MPAAPNSDPMAQLLQRIARHVISHPERFAAMGQARREAMYKHAWATLRHTAPAQANLHHMPTPTGGAA